MSEMDFSFHATCPACGDVIDYCHGHGEIGDPDGYRVLQKHDNDDHSDCYDCEEYDA